MCQNSSNLRHKLLLPGFVFHYSRALPEPFQGRCYNHAPMNDGPQKPEDAAAAPEPGRTLIDIAAPAKAAPDTNARTVSHRSTRAVADSGELKIGRYRILKEHARGGMGRVLLAVDTTIGRNVAVKELLSGVLAQAPDSAATKSIGERFLREARVTGRLEHPNIVPVYEIGTADNGSLFYSMRFVGGRTMAQRLDAIAASGKDAREKLAARLQLLESFGDMCNAVAYAHSKGVIHRDLKPSNVMLGEFGETVVLDWGLARSLNEEDLAIAASVGGQEGSSQLTLDGTVVGTPAYMPPEQAAGDQANVDELSDVYALGAVLYEILTGVPPFEGKSAHAILERVVNEAPRPVLEIEPGVPRELAVLCARAMERKRENRLPSALDLSQEIKAFRDGKTLASYEYSSLELLQRFLKRQWKLVAVVIVALGTVAAIGAWAVSEIVAERNIAQSALATAREEEDKRVQAENLAAEREKSLLESRQEAIKRAQDNLAGFNAEPLLRDLFLRVDGYRRDNLELRLMDSDERARNRALITAVLGYAAQLQELLRLRGLSAEADSLAELRRIQGALIELAIFDGDFELAQYMLSGSNLADDEISALNKRNGTTRRALLQWRKLRILECIEDARLGLRREGRVLGAPGVRAYVAELSAFQDEQTAQMLAEQITRLRNEIAALKRPPNVLEFDQAELYCGALGRLQRPLACVPVLSDFLAAQDHPRLCASAANALAETQHRLGTLALIDAAKRRGLRFIEDNRAALARAFLPPGLADEQPEAAGLLRFARRDFEQAELHFDKASQGPFALLCRGLMRLEQNRREEALRDLAVLVDDAPKSVHAHIALARAQDEGEAEATLNRAVALKPPSVDALVARCQFYFERDYAKALADIEAALALAPGRADLFQIRGDVMRVMGRLEDAIACYDSAIESDPDNALAWIFKAEVQRGLTREFLPAALRAVELAPENSHAWAYLCQAYFFKVQLEQAVEAGKKSVALNAREQEGWYYIALSYLRMRADGAPVNKFINARASHPRERENMQQAVMALRGLLRANSQDFRSWAILGHCLLALGHDAEARDALEQASRLAFLEANTTGMGMSMVRGDLALLDARSRRVAAPSTLGQYLDAALVEAHAAAHEHEVAKIRARLRIALDCLAQADEISAADERETRARKRRVRGEIAGVMAQAGFFAELAAVIEPAIKDEPAWVVYAQEFAAGEALVAAGLQYREGKIEFLGRDDADVERMQREFDTLTGLERKRLGEDMITRGFARLVSLAEKGYDHHDFGRTLALEPLGSDARAQAMVDAFKKSRREGQSANPYAVLVVQGVRPGTQARALGVRQFDVIATVNGEPVNSVAALRAEIGRAAGKESYELVLRRYRRDENGELVLRRDAQGKPMLDERQNPIADYETMRVYAKPGTLGVNLETGYLPHPMDE